MRYRAAALCSTFLSVAACATQGTRAPAPAPAPVTLAEVEYLHSNDTTRDSHYKVKLGPEVPANWLSPIDYTRGQFHVRLEILSKPSAEPTVYTICMIGAPSYACVASRPYTAPGVIEYALPLSKAWHFDRVDWSQRPRHLQLVVKDGHNIKPAAENVGEERSALFMPTKVKVTITLVPPAG